VGESDDVDTSTEGGGDGWVVSAPVPPVPLISGGNVNVGEGVGVVTVVGLLVGDGDATGFAVVDTLVDDGDVGDGVLLESVTVVVNGVAGGSRVMGRDVVVSTEGSFEVVVVSPVVRVVVNNGIVVGGRLQGRVVGTPQS